jgi:aspartate 1-decarboxylase
MMIQVLKSKIHNVKITFTELNYIGSITIDADLLDAANMIENEKVLVVNNTNGERIETYVIKGARGSGMIGLNGAAARRGMIGDEIIIISFALMDFEAAKTHQPWLVFPNAFNKL